MAESLWPEFTAPRTGSFAAYILQEQAHLLPEETSGLLRAEVRTKCDESGFTSKLFVAAPAFGEVLEEVVSAFSPATGLPVTIQSRFIDDIKRAGDAEEF